MGNKKNKNKSKDIRSEKTISSTLSNSLTKIIDEINRNYYVKMQPQIVRNSRIKEYQQLLLEINNKNAKNKKELMVKMQEILKENYEQNNRQKIYTNKFDKLQSVLLSKSDNKRAQMELMLILINEGYRDKVKDEFPKEDYELIDKLIKEYYDKTIKPEDAKKQIDDYCI